MRCIADAVEVSDGTGNCGEEEGARGGPRVGWRLPAPSAPIVVGLHVLRTCVSRWCFFLVREFVESKNGGEGGGVTVLTRTGGSIGLCVKAGRWARGVAV